MEDLQIVLHAAMPMKRTLSGTVCSAQTHVYQLHCLLEKFSQELNLPPESAQLIQARLTEKISRLSATRAKSIIGIIASTLSAVQKARSGDDSAQAGVRSALELMGRASSLEGFNALISGSSNTHPKGIASLSSPAQPTPVEMCAVPVDVALYGIGTGAAAGAQPVGVIRKPVRWNCFDSDVHHKVSAMLRAGKPVALKIIDLPGELLKTLAEVELPHASTRLGEWMGGDSGRDVSAADWSIGSLDACSHPSGDFIWNGVRKALGLIDATGKGANFGVYKLPAGNNRPLTTRLHFHGPAVLNMWLYGNAAKEYELVPWCVAKRHGLHQSTATEQDREEATRRFDGLKASPDWSDCFHARLSGAAKEPNCIIWPPLMLHEVSTMQLPHSPRPAYVTCPLPEVPEIVLSPAVADSGTCHTALPPMPVVLHPGLCLALQSYVHLDEEAYLTFTLCCLHEAESEHSWRRQVDKDYLAGCEGEAQQIFAGAGKKAIELARSCSTADAALTRLRECVSQSLCSKKRKAESDLELLEMGSRLSLRTA